VIARGLAEQFVGRELRAVVAGDDEVMVCDPPAAAERLRELYSREAITGDALHRLGAFVWFGAEGLRPRTAQRRAAELRRLGLALTRGRARDCASGRVPAGVRCGMGGLMLGAVLRDHCRRKNPHVRQRSARGCP
jgi:hypothetical protein